MPASHLPRSSPLGRVWSALLHPVHPENLAHLAELWSEHQPELRFSVQMVGVQWEGCAATIGAMPRCDFGCTACYLGPEANRVPAAPLAVLVEQLRLIRTRVGRRGNVQLTDGELTLRPAAEVATLVRAARELELIPMLMTHGEVLRREPAYLDTLIEAGLTELSLHVDTTQRGRGDWDDRRTEKELHPLREEFAQLVRDARRRSGRELRVAATVTVTEQNLAGVASIVRWSLENTDVFRMLSFQPVAHVGRTRERGAVTRDALWSCIGEGLGEDPAAPRRAVASDLVFGHPDCTHVVMGAVYTDTDRAPRFVPLRDPTSVANERDLALWFERFGGLSFREDGGGEALARGLGLLARAPDLALWRVPRWLARNLARLEQGTGARPALRAATRLARGRARLTPLAIVSHHFMDAAELASPRGAEREAACVFRVPVNGELVSMCRANAGGLRTRVYAELSGDLAPSAAPEGAPSHRATAQAVFRQRAE